MKSMQELRKIEDNYGRAIAYFVTPEWEQRILEGLCYTQVNSNEATFRSVYSIIKQFVYDDFSVKKIESILNYYIEKKSYEALLFHTRFHLGMRDDFLLNPEEVRGKKKEYLRVMMDGSK